MSDPKSIVHVDTYDAFSLFDNKGANPQDMECEGTEIELREISTEDLLVTEVALDSDTDCACA